MDTFLFFATMECMTNTKKLFGDKKFYISALLLALPVMGQNLIESLVNLIDNFMVSGLGDIKMSGTSVSGQIIFVFMVLLNAVCMSGGIFLTQYRGADDKEGMKQAVLFKTIVSGALLVIYLLICLVFPRQVLSMLLVGNNEAAIILDEGVKYMHMMAFCGLPMVVSYICSSSLKEIGYVKQPLYVAFLAAVINMIFNYLLIYGNFGFPRLEVVGAALATVIARTIEAVVFLHIIRKGDAPFAIKPKDILKVDFSLFKNIFSKGARVMASELIWAIAETITVALYNGKGGADVVSGMSASFTIANLYFTAFGGVNIATGVIIGKLLGEGKLEEAREKRRWISSGAAVFSIFVTLIAVSTTLLVPIVYSNLSLSAQGICAQMVFYMALFMPAWIIFNVQMAIARAGGDTNMAFILDGMVNIFGMIPLVIYLAKFTSVGPVGIYCLSKLVDVARVIACYFWLKREKWLVNLTNKEV